MGNNNLDSIELGHESTAPINSTFSLCEWKLVMETYESVKILISKDTANYEDLYIYVMTQNGSKYYYLNELSSCDSNVLELEFEMIKYLSIRADKLSTDSNYSIFIEREGLKNDILMNIFVSIMLGLIMLIFTIVTLILLYFSFKQWLKERKARIESEQEIRNLIGNKIQWIDDTISSMSSGAFHSLVQKFITEN